MMSYFQYRLFKKISSKNTYFLSKNIEETQKFFYQCLSKNHHKKIIFSSNILENNPNFSSLHPGQDIIEFPFLFFHRSVFYSFISSFIQQIIFHDFSSNIDQDYLTTLLFKQYQKISNFQECSLYDFFHSILQMDEDKHSLSHQQLQADLLKIEKFIEKESTFLKNIIFRQKIKSSYFLFDQYSYSIISSNIEHQKIISFLFSATIFHEQSKLIQNFQKSEQKISFYFLNFFFDPDITPYDNNLLMPNTNYYFYIFENEYSKNLNLNNFFYLFISLDYLFSKRIESNNLVRLFSFLSSELLFLYSQIYPNFYILSSFDKNELCYFNHLTIYNFKS